MNKRSYRLVFSRRLGMLVPVSEERPSCCGARDNAQRSKAVEPVALSITTAQPLRLVLALAAAMLSWAGGSVWAQALPQGGQVMQGGGNITASASKLTVTQNTQLMGVNWQSFNIGAGNTVQFVQPNAQAVAINSVLGNNRSEIYGNLQANGQVFLLNPNGVLFGPNAQVDTGALLATTARQVTQDASGQWQLSNKGSGQIINQGQLRAQNGGFVVLDSGSGVANSGQIQARQGTVALTVGQTTSLALDNNSLLKVKVNGAVLNALVDNQGLILADGGAVYLTTRGKDLLLASVVNQSGLVQARSIKSEGGRILLDGGDSGTVQLSGMLDASGQAIGDQGGQIDVAGQYITLQAANLNASGNTASGSIRVGGDYQGASIDGLATARTVQVDASSRFDISSSGAGNAGRAIVWSEDRTAFSGQIDGQAKDTQHGGDGGFAEVSSRGALGYTGQVNMLALNQRRRIGSLVLDPYNLTISDGTDYNSSGLAASGTGSVINTTTLQNALATANVTVTTGSSGAETGNITVANNITWSANTALTLSAAGGIILSPSATITNSSMTSALTLTAAGTGGVSGTGNIALGGALTFNVTNASAAGSLSGLITGAGSLTKSGAGTLTLSGANTYTGATTVSAGTLRGGSATAFGTGAITVTSGAVLDLNGQTMTSTGGLTLNGTGISSGGALLNSSATGATYAGLVTLGSAASIVGTGAITLSNPGVITGSGFGLTLGGVVGGTIASIIGTGTGSLTKQAAGAWTLTGANTYSGGTTISAGILAAGSATAFGTGAITVAPTGAALDLNGQTMTSTGTLTLQGTGLGALGALRNNSTTGATYAGTILLAANSRIIGGTGAITLSNTSAITGGNFTLTLGGAAGGTLAATIDSTTASLTKQDAGAWTLTGANTYSGGTTISAGTLTVGSAAALGSTGSIVMTGGALRYGSGVATDFSARLLTTGGQAWSIDTNGQSVTFAAALQGASSLVKSGTGTLTLSGANTYTGTTTINGGTLNIGTGSFNGALASASAVSIASGANLNWVSNSALTISNAITGAGNVNISTTGNGSHLTWGGMLDLTGSSSLVAAVSGDITLSSGATLASAGGLTLAATGNFINNAGSSAVSSSNGRWTIYSAAPVSNTFGGLDSSNSAVWGTAYVPGQSIPSFNSAVTGNRYVFGQTQSMTVTTTDNTTVYGTVKNLSANTVFSGATPGVTGAFRQSTLADVFGPNGLSVTSTGYLNDSSTAKVAGTPYAITATGSAVDGSTITFSNVGQLTITPKALTVTGSSAAGRAYDGTTAASITVGTLSGLVGSETVTATAVGTFDSANAGSRSATAVYTLGDGTAGGLAGNYTLANTTGLGATITPKALTVTGSSAADKVYDGTTTAQVTGGTLVGLVQGESLRLSQDGAFANSSVGTAKTVSVVNTIADGTNESPRVSWRPVGLS
jgi:fibronectin-binding autotransporter adhesin